MSEAAQVRWVTILVAWAEALEEEARARGDATSRVGDRAGSPVRSISIDCQPALIRSPPPTRRRPGGPTDRARARAPHEASPGWGTPGGSHVSRRAHPCRSPGDSLRLAPCGYAPRDFDSSYRGSSPRVGTSTYGIPVVSSDRSSDTSQRVDADPLVAALGKALEGASAAGRWDVVAQLAKELEARRLAREPNVVAIRRAT